jgi:hypothetical protein
VLAATAAELAEFQTFSSRLLVLGRCVIATFAINALQHDVVTRHSFVSLIGTHASGVHFSNLRSQI